VSTFVKFDILIFVSFKTSDSHQHIRKFGFKPTSLKSLTPCYVGLVFYSSPAIKGTNETRPKAKFSQPTFKYSYQIAS